MADVLLMGAEAIGAALDRMTQEIAGRFGGARGLALIGIRTRGEFLARRLQAALDRLAVGQVPVGALDITVHRDDFDALREEIGAAGSRIDFEPGGRPIVLVDDVLFTGRSARAAMDAVIARGRPSVIALAVLIDRGHRELPIQADFVGRTVETARDERVRVQLQEVDEVDQVILTRANTLARSSA